MKKILALFLAIMMTLSLAACFEETAPVKTEESNTEESNALDDLSAALGDLSNKLEEAVGEIKDNNEDESIPLSKRNAVRKAKDYLKTMAFSRDGLVAQLEFEQFPTEDAVYGVDNCGADWNEQAVEKAKDYLETMPFSHSGLIKQLEFEKFTTEQAQHGVDNCGADWNEQAAKKAKDYLDLMAFSRDGLITQLEFDGFTNEQAVHGVNSVGL